MKEEFYKNLMEKANEYFHKYEMDDFIMEELSNPIEIINSHGPLECAAKLWAFNAFLAKTGVAKTIELAQVEAWFDEEPWIKVVEAMRECPLTMAYLVRQCREIGLNDYPDQYKIFG